MKRFLNSFKYAFEGIITTIKEERNIKIHILAVVVVIIMGVIYKISQVEWIICLILFGLVISSETINTSIENAVDLITKEENELAKKAKDAAAGAVLVNAIISAIIAGIIWIPKIF
ncbi:MAG: diacylglycerol kinase family protein [Clostridia bacterium]|jgi:diacylglycerol kinase|nr:diacylglycerol kinase family protein [Clostridia bacterium]